MSNRCGSLYLLVENVTNFLSQSWYSCIAFRRIDITWLRCIVAMVLRCFCHGFFIGLLKKHFRFVLIWVTQYQLIWVTRFQLIRVTLCYVSLSWRFLCLGVSIFCMLFFLKCYIAKGRLDFILNFLLDLWILIMSQSDLGSDWGPVVLLSGGLHRACTGQCMSAVPKYTKSGKEDTISEKEYY